jgi:uncharacterized protein
MTNRQRRVFFKHSAACAGRLFTAATLGSIANCARIRNPFAEADAGYGALAPVEDQHGDTILALPSGFRYVTFGKVGEPMRDGTPTPINPDGMGAFAGSSGAVRLLRNHEVGKNDLERVQPALGPVWTRYDTQAVGGVVAIDFDPRSFVDPRRYPPVLRSFVSLSGTLVNCAGGYALGETGWLSCEETLFGPEEGWLERHGYVFLVRAAASQTLAARPIRGMGRFKHEAAVADQTTGIVYETEDAWPNAGSGFYRYLPANRGDLYAGGTLQMLRVANNPCADLREEQTIGQSMAVDWVTIKNPDPDLERDAPRVFDQGFTHGGALFNRLEGIFRGADSSIYFASTSGGDTKNGNVNADGYHEGYGQIWRYVPGAERDKLMLVFESPGQTALDSPDNIAVTPRGGLLICEDCTGARDARTDYASTRHDAHVNRLIGLTRAGRQFDFAVNRLNGTELAGACFSPRGNILFVNIYGDGGRGSGMTCAIIGPWASGPL